MAATWRVFSNKITLQPENAEKVVLACCVLHNYLRHHNQVTCTVDTENVLGSWRNEPRHAFGELDRVARRPGFSAKDVRDEFCNYFNDEGAVGWQDAMVQ